MVRVRFRHEQKEIPLARRQHAIEAEHSAPEGNGSSRSVRLGVPRRRDKRGRRRTVARAIPRSLSLTKYTINEGARGRCAEGEEGVASLKGGRGRGIEDCTPLTLPHELRPMRRRTISCSAASTSTSAAIRTEPAPQRSGRVRPGSLTIQLDVYVTLLEAEQFRANRRQDRQGIVRVVLVGADERPPAPDLILQYRADVAGLLADPRPCRAPAATPASSHPTRRPSSGCRSEKRRRRLRDRT